MEQEFLKRNQTVCNICYQTPEILKKKANEFPDILKRFQEQAKKDTQGLGNQETDHEVSFAGVLESVGFQFLIKKKKNDHLKLLPTLSDGFYYIYQVNGSQQSLDFQTILVMEHQIKKTCTYDLKHTTTDQFCLNDGWFLQDIIYVITWMCEKEKIKTFLALGQTIPSEKEKEVYANIVLAKKLLNSQVKDHTDISLVVYHRFANRYSCKKFTDEYSTERFQEVISFLT